MLLLYGIAISACTVLVAVAAALWWSIRREHAADLAHPAFAESMQHAQKPPHPRMDLAAGVAAGTVRLARPMHGAARRRGLTLDAEAEAAAKTAGEKATTQLRRLDWAFYNENMGDLSDPDPRRAPAGGVRRPLGTVSIPESR